MATSIRFSEHLVMAGFEYVYGISAADITVGPPASAERGSNELRW